MSENMYVSTSGAVTRMRQLEILANNLANADSVGFKAGEALFGHALAGASDPNDTAAFVQTEGIVTDFRQGPMSTTGRALDAAIDGPGFFTVQTPAGVRYTRAGSFSVDVEGKLTTPDGYPVLGVGGPIEGVGALAIQSDGRVVDAVGNSIGSLRIERFDTPALLEKEGSALFRAPAGAVGDPVVTPHLKPQSIEQSNVRPTEQLANLMILQRAFDASLRALRADDQATERLLQEMGR